MLTVWLITDQIIKDILSILKSNTYEQAGAMGTGL